MFLNVKRCVLLFLLMLCCKAYAQQRYELIGGRAWVAVHESRLSKTRAELSTYMLEVRNSIPMIVPGTILSSLVYNRKAPNPFYGMNNEVIPDVSVAGWSTYTFWYLKDFEEKAEEGEHVFLHFRGVNYTFEVYLNGYKVNQDTAQGMFLRHSFEVTQLLAKDGRNRLAVLVYPPRETGSANGGQGGDGTIAKNVTNQYVAGWDWIQPMRDRNTGIWDKVFIEKVRGVNVKDVHITTKGTAQAEIQASAMVEELTGKGTKGKLQYSIGGRTQQVDVTLKPFEKRMVTLPVMTLDKPRLWWPNGMGGQELYEVGVKFTRGKTVCDEEALKVGIRDISTRWNLQTQSREIWVNGKRMFVKGANWILTDAMLRFGKERYDAEIHYHRDMNLNMIRVWGGGITERPEFYEACDKYGLLVMQDFWMTGDCNGRWHDTYKKDDTNTRRQYPDNHQLWLESAADQIKMLRNHASLALWCGGNEIRPPADILRALRDTLLPQLDGTRYFFEFSNHDSMSLNAHDGPYTIQKDSYFWEHKSWGFNSEVGSVGIGDIESLRRFIPEGNLVPPYYDTVQRKWVIDSVWRYHKYYSYDSSVEVYGHPEDARAFAWQAQLVNYNQYRALMEGIRSHMWNWYTGVLEWKTQNPWTAMVGQMYDVYLDPNACMFGLKTGAKPVHVMYNPISKKIMIVNDSHIMQAAGLSWSIISGNTVGKEPSSTGTKEDILLMLPPDTCIAIEPIAADLARYEQSGAFLSLRLNYCNNQNECDSDKNLYWLPNENGSYKWLQNLAPEGIYMGANAKYTDSGKIELKLNYSGTGIAFFNHITVVDKATKRRLLPVFSSDNYVSLHAQKREQTIEIEFKPQEGTEPVICIQGWNTGKRYVEIENPPGLPKGR